MIKFLAPSRFSFFFLLYCSTYSIIYFLIFLGYGASAESPQEYLFFIIFLLVELFIIILILSAIVSVSRRIWVSWSALLIFSFIFSIYYAQIFSVYVSGGVINQVAIENTEDIQWINSPSLWISLSLHIFYLLLSYYFFFGRSRLLKIGFSANISFRGVPIILLLSSLIFVLNYSSDKFNQKQVLKSPAFSIFETYGSFLIDNPPVFIQKVYFDYFESEAENGGLYPFEVDHIQVQFSKNHNIDLGGSNVIVFFVEGLSSRFVSGYGEKYPDLTPNIKRFMNSSLSVDNYFNHTAATFRGIQGQLTSSYPKAHGPADWKGLSGPSVAKNYRTLPNILKGFNYETTFINSGNNRLLNMLNAMEFDKVYSGKEAASDFLGLTFNHSVSDAQMMDIMVKYLEGRNPNASQPFFLATYNVGTHAMRDSPEDGVKFGDGKNRTLNRIKHFDAQFGHFLRFFENSKFSKNTILVLTADHSTYPEASTINAGSVYGDYKPFFVDEIPFIIRYPNQKLLGFYDAKGRTSLDFAPTLLDLLNISNTKNSFLGSSIFNKNPKYVGGLSFIGGEFYYIKDNRVFMEADLAANDKLIYDELINDMRFFNRLEAINRVSSK
jgi:lipoteichoic acid synthase